MASLFLQKVTYRDHFSINYLVICVSSCLFFCLSGTFICQPVSCDIIWHVFTCCVQWLGKESLLATDTFLFVYIIGRRYHHVTFISFGEAFVVLTLSNVLCACGVYCHFNTITATCPNLVPWCNVTVCTSFGISRLIFSMTELILQMFTWNTLHFK